MRGSGDSDGVLYDEYLQHGIEYGSTNRNVYTISEGDPLSAKAECYWDLTIGRGDWQTRVKTFSAMTADESTFYLVNQVEAYEGEKQIFTKTWKKEISRNFQ